MDNLRKHLPFRQPSGPGEQSRSVFHMPLPNTPKMDIQECRLGIAQYIATWNNFCGAGSHLSQIFKDLMKDNGCTEVAGQFQDRLGEMEHVTGNVSAQVKGEMDGMLIALDGKLDAASEVSPELEKDKEQVLAQCYLTFLQMHCQFFASSAEMLTPFTKYQTLDDLKCQTVKTDSAGTEQTEKPLVDLSDQSGDKKDDVNQSVNRKDNENKTGSYDSPSSLRRQIHSFFNKLGQKPNDTPQSLFYVDITKEAGSSSSSNQNQVAVQDSQSESSTSREAGLTPIKTGAILGRNLQGTNGRQSGVSQEELDSVIDLLSGGQKPPMTPIPEIPMPQQHPLHPVGYTNQPIQLPPAGDFGSDLGYYGNLNQHRRSDGLIGETTKDFGRNTWPSNLQHRNSLPAEITQQPFALFGEATPDAEFTNYIASITRQLKQASIHGNELVTPAWSTGEAKLNKSWPLNSAHNERSDLLANSWAGAGVQDSSSCSDESSCGETPFSMGLDLVSAMNNRRRHSSGEDGFHDNQVIMVAPTEPKHKSVDDLHLEPKSTSTWPPKLSWSRPPEGNPSMQGAGNFTMPGIPMQNPGHAQLRMQWSDPLTGQSPSPWTQTGLPPHLTSQPPPSFPNPPPGGSTDIHPHSKVERKFSMPT